MLSRIKKIFSEYRQLKWLAYHDSLTGLRNRNWLYKNKDSIKFKYVYFIDINDLKKQNALGHTNGDAHIKRVVNSISNLIEDDVLVRYAGDEFILFSNRKGALYTNEYYSVGWSDMNGHVMIAIGVADMNMIANKRRWKHERE